MNILVTGATGTIGKPLCSFFLNHGFHVTALSRNEHAARKILPENCSIVEWNEQDTSWSWSAGCDNIDTVVNLAGAPLADKRWSRSWKEQILNSRINATKAVVNAIIEKKIRPKTLINSSAVGYYGSHPDRSFSENDPPGDGFLSEVCQQWEHEAKRAESAGVRVVPIRTGVVLSKEGGTLKKMATPFKLCLGGYFGSGSQWFSWIHVNDVIFSIQHIIENPAITGPVNIVSPEPVPFKTFAQSFGAVLRRPVFISIPRFPLRIRFGDMADMLFDSQKVKPDVLLTSGYTFHYETIEHALKNLLSTG
jgi:uncharacterized protein (TIGR01777 family)